MARAGVLHEPCIILCVQGLHECVYACVCVRVSENELLGRGDQVLCRTCGKRSQLQLTANVDGL